MEKASILIVEDEAIVAADIEDCLKNLGYGVCGIASTGESALRLARDAHPSLVFMDIRLKGEMDGIDAALYIKEHLDIPVIYLTAHADDTTLERAKITEPYGYILKPFEEIELYVALELALHKHKLNKVQPLRQREVIPSSDEEFSPETIEKYQFLRQIEPFAQLPKDSLKMFAARCHLRQFAAGELMAFEGDPEADGFLVMSGRLAMVKTSASGRELIVELLPAGDVFALIAALENEAYSYTARAQISSEILCIPRSALIQLLDQHPDLYRSFVDVISARLRRSHDASRALAHDKVDVRIASALLGILPHFGLSDSGTQFYELNITRQELADLTGTTVETAIRVTKNMERAGLLDLSHTGVIKILNVDKLRALIEA